MRKSPLCELQKERVLAKSSEDLSNTVKVANKLPKKKVKCE